MRRPGLSTYLENYNIIVAFCQDLVQGSICFRVYAWINVVEPEKVLLQLYYVVTGQYLTRTHLYLLQSDADWNVSVLALIELGAYSENLYIQGKLV